MSSFEPHNSWVSDKAVVLYCSKGAGSHGTVMLIILPFFTIPGFTLGMEFNDLIF